MADHTRAEVESHRTQDGRTELKETPSQPARRRRGRIAGERNSPQTLCLGKADFSKIRTGAPSRMAANAAITPAGPPPTTWTARISAVGEGPSGRLGRTAPGFNFRMARDSLNAANAGHRAAISGDGSDSAANSESAFARHGSPRRWRDGVYDHHHHRATGGIRDTAKNLTAHLLCG